MLDIKKVLTAKPKAHEEAQLARLTTPWGEGLGTTSPLPEHPLPQARREGWKSLNGVWRCMFTAGAPAVEELPQALTKLAAPSFAGARPIVVPFSPEAPLSCVERQLKPNELLWYTCEFDAPATPQGWLLTLRFLAVDYACAAWLNGELLGTHLGGYTPFSFDIGRGVKPTGNQLVLCVADPSEEGKQLRGKQRLSRGDIWYTAQSGIWQSVWLEWMPPEHVGAFSLEASWRSRSLKVQASAPQLEVRVLDAEGELVATGTGPSCEISLPNARPWSPQDPYLYQVELICGDDVVHSYCGFRDVEMREDAAGTKRMFLNGEPVFLKGVLDQGYWPDGLMTAPSDEALVFDIEQARSLGFNMMRKHIKIECPRWYYHCDRLGMLVWQDMVSGGDVWNTWHVSYKPTLFKASWSRYSDTSPAHQANLLAGCQRYRQEWSSTMLQTIDLLRNHPSVVTWVLFNEGWGQFDACKALEAARAADPTRPIDAVSGWYDQRCGDFKSVHNYFRELEVWPCRSGRAFVISEFGGLSLACAGHTSLPEMYGYSNYESAASWQDAVRELLAHMDSLEEKGLAGYVYTQLTDVEEEVNGLITYDRRVNKLRAAE